MIRLPGTYNRMAQRLRGEAFAFGGRTGTVGRYTHDRLGQHGPRKREELRRRRAVSDFHEAPHDDPRAYGYAKPRAGFSGGPVGSEHCSIDRIGPPTGMGCGSVGGCGGGSVGGCGCVGASSGDHGHDHDHDHDHGAGSEPCCDGCATGKGCGS